MLGIRQKSGGISFRSTSEDNQRKRLIDRIKELEKENKLLNKRIDKLEKLIDCLEVGK